MIASSVEPLDLAVGQGLSVELVAQMGGRAQRHRGKFLVQNRAEGARGLWVHALGEDDRAMERLATAKGSLHGTFTLNGTRYRFTSEVVRRDKRWLDHRMMVDAVLLAEPSAVDRVEHRQHERVFVSDSGVQARLYLPHATLPKPIGRDGSEIEVKPWNLSVGGAAVVFPLDRRFMLLANGDALVIGLAYRGKRAKHLCALRHVTRLSNNIARVGVEFIDEGHEAPENKEFRVVVEELIKRAKVSKPKERAAR